jgi:hypothetical protein
MSLGHKDKCDNTPKIAASPHGRFLTIRHDGRSDHQRRPLLLTVKATSSMSALTGIQAHQHAETDYESLERWDSKPPKSCFLAKSSRLQSMEI